MTVSILVADDDPFVRNVVEMLLQGTDRHVVFAENGQVALELARSETPDLLLIDLNMPVMDGWQVIEKIRAENSALAKVSIIALTGHREADARDNAHAAGCDRVLSKPLTSETLNAAIASALERA